MSDKFQLLLKQIRFPKDHKTYNEIKDGSIQSVKPNTFGWRALNHQKTH